MEIKTKKDFANRLKSAPKAKDVIGDLFKKVWRTSEQRFFLTILDFYRHFHKDKSGIGFDIRPGYIIQQFAEFYNQILIVQPKDFNNEIHSNFVRRIHMLAYSQFWECRGIQRFLLSLVRIANKQQYDPLLLLNTKRPCPSIFEQIISIAKKETLLLGEFLTAIYSNQIRNAFAHSEIIIYNEAKYITLENHDDKNNTIPSLRFDTWELLFKMTREFIDSLFLLRVNFERILKSKTPYKIPLPEFETEFEIYKDSRGYWTLKFI